MKLIPFIFILLLFSCSPKEQPDFTITGTIQAPDGMIYLSTYRNPDIFPDNSFRDSTRLEDGKFTFVIPKNNRYTMKYRLTVESRRSQWFLLEPIDQHIDIKDIQVRITLPNATVSVIQKEYAYLDSVFMATSDRSIFVKDSLRTAQHNTIKDFPTYLDSVSKDMVEHYNKAIEKVAHDNPNSTTALWFIESRGQQNALLTKAFYQLSDSLRTSVLGRHIHQRWLDGDFEFGCIVD